MSRGFWLGICLAVCLAAAGCRAMPAGAPQTEGPLPTEGPSPAEGPLPTEGPSPTEGPLPTESSPAGAVEVLLDGEAWDGAAVDPEAEGPRVYITLDGEALIDVPFSQARTVTVLQPDGGENAVAITGGAVYMEHANCDNQDCVNMGEVTLDNLELRVMGGFIICLPHRISVEVRE